MNFNDLTPELQEKAKACKALEDLHRLTKREGRELSDEELDGVSGGWCEVLCYSACWTNRCEDLDM